MTNEENIIIKLIGEADMGETSKAMQDQLDKSAALDKRMRDLAGRYVEAEKNIKNLNLFRTQEEKVMAQLDKEYRGLAKDIKAEQDATKRRIETIQQNTKAMNLMANSTDTARKRLAEMRNLMAQMEDSDNTGKVYEQLAIKAAELTDQMGDMQQRINVLASDTKNLDAAIGVGSGLAGTFNVATSAVALFGGETEELEKAFYKVQNVMSIVNGLTEVANFLNRDSAAMIVLNTAYEKLRAKAKAKSAAAITTETVATTAETAAVAAETTAVGAATTAQWKLNAAFLANPIGVIVGVVLAAVAAFAALGVAVYEVVHYFSAAGKAEREYKQATKDLEKELAAQAITQSKRDYQRQQQQEKTAAAEDEALRNARKRNASEVEMAMIKSKYAKQNAEDTAKYANNEIRLSNKLVADYKRQRDAKAIQLENARVGSKKYKKLQEELAEAEQNYYNQLQKGKDLEKMRSDARKEAAEAELELLEAQKAARLQLAQANIDLMNEGAEKEIAAINLNYKEQMKAIQGNTQEEIALRKALEEKKAKEIAAVQKRYAAQAMQTEADSMKNLLAAMQRVGGTEAAYEAQIDLQKDIAEKEAEARIEALDKAVLGEKGYKNQVEAIRLQLANDLKAIDDAEAERKADNARRITKIEVDAAKQSADALTGAETLEYQKQVWKELYAAKEDQLKENARLDIESVQRSADTEEVKAAKIKEIQANLNADLKELQQERANTEIELQQQTTAALEIELQKAERTQAALQKGGTTSQQIAAAREVYDAKVALINQEQAVLEEQRAAGLISQQEYNAQSFQLEVDASDARMELLETETQARLDAAQRVLDAMTQLSSAAFELMQSNVQAEMDALEKMYTTDAEEAKKDASKKLITQKEYEKKKAELETRAAKMRKAQALLDIALNTAAGIMQAIAQFGPPPSPMGIAGIAMATALGAIQFGIAASKPLPQYAKGRKGGPGEYALVGEKGPELMYVPQGASIVPNSKLSDMSAWSAYGVPELPNVGADAIAPYVFHADIDYDRLGKAVAANIPQQKAVMVNVDRNGIRVTDGHDTHTYLNKKYNGSWH